VTRTRAAPAKTVATVAVGGAVAGALVVSIVLGWALRGPRDEARCGPGFHAVGARCMVEARGVCPPPLAKLHDGACGPPDERVLVPETALAIGPSDWEAEGLVGARTIRVAAFHIDAFEVTENRYRPGASEAQGDRAARGMSLDDAAAFCAARGGRLPTEDEWIVAAAAPAGAAGSATPSASRYPWGETGAVCRRAAWGLSKGPCATGADGPDTVGSHPDGDSRSGLHDLAGNVAEWVTSAPSERGIETETAIAKGGSWQSSLASELRTWARLELPPHAGDPRVGFRCAYP
jgi:formylglycine-generating enzyme required for sulfatase activity